MIRSIDPVRREGGHAAGRLLGEDPLKSPALRSFASSGDPSEGGSPVAAKEAYQRGPPTMWLTSSRTCQEAHGVAPDEVRRRHPGQHSGWST